MVDAPRRCEACNGNGLLFGPGPTKPAPAIPVPTNGAPQAVEYWPQRLVTTVTENTLEGWKKKLEEQAVVVRAELAKLQGGAVQIEQEFARRAELVKERKKAYGR